MNKQQNDYSVYMHTFPDGKKYIGATCRDPKKRWANGRGYTDNHEMDEAIKEVGWDNIQHDILGSNMSKESAMAEERRLIKENNTTNPEYGFNHHPGGTGSNRGIICSDESRDKRRAAMTGRFSGVYVGGNSPRAREVNQYDKNGNYISTYGSTTEAAEAINKDYSSIVRCCHGEYCTCGGYIWAYKDENESTVVKNAVNKINTPKRLSIQHRTNISNGMKRYRENERRVEK